MASVQSTREINMLLLWLRNDSSPRRISAAHRLTKMIQEKNFRFLRFYPSTFSKSTSENFNSSNSFDKVLIKVDKNSDSFLEISEINVFENSNFNTILLFTCIYMYNTRSGHVRGTQSPATTLFRSRRRD